MPKSLIAKPHTRRWLTYLSAISLCFSLSGCAELMPALIGDTNANNSADRWLSGLGKAPERSYDEVSHWNRYGEIGWEEALQFGHGLYTHDPELSQFVQTLGERMVAGSDKISGYHDFAITNSAQFYAIPYFRNHVAISRTRLAAVGSDEELAAILAEALGGLASGYLSDDMLRQVAITKDERDSIFKIWFSDENLARMLEADQIAVSLLQTINYEFADYLAYLLKQKRSLTQSGNLEFNQIMDALYSGRIKHLTKQFGSTESKSLAGANEYARTAKLRAQQKLYTQVNVLANTAITADSDAAYTSAITKIAEIAQQMPDEAIFQWVQGQLYAHQEQWAKTVEYSTAAIDINPENYRYYFARGIAHAEQDNKTLADEDFEISKTLLPRLANHLNAQSEEDGEDNDKK